MYLAADFNQCFNHMRASGTAYKANQELLKDFELFAENVTSDSFKELYPEFFI